MDKLPREIVGYILSFLSYKDWSNAHLSSKIFHSKDHDGARRTGLMFSRELRRKNRSHEYIYLDKPFISYLGTKIDVTLNRLNAELERVFSGPLPYECAIEGHTLLQSMLGFRFTKMEVHVSSQSEARILKLIKLPVKRITTRDIGSRDAIKYVVECEGDYEVIIYLVHQQRSMVFLPGEQHICIDREGFFTLAYGLLSEGFSTISEYKKFEKYGLRLSNKGAMRCSPNFVRFPQCTQPRYKVDEYGVHRTGVEFVFEFRELKPHQRYLQLVDMNGLKVDLFTRQVYNPLTKAISGAIGFRGEFVTKIIEDAIGDTHHEAFSNNRPCSSNTGDCGHSFLLLPYQGPIATRFHEGDSCYMFCPQVTVRGNVKETLWFMGDDSHGLTSEEETLLAQRNSNFLLVQAMDSQEVVRRVYGSEVFGNELEMFIRQGFFMVTENNFEWWIEKFKLSGAYDYFKDRITSSFLPKNMNDDLPWVNDPKLFDIEKNNLYCILIEFSKGIPGVNISQRESSYAAINFFERVDDQ